MSSDYPKFRVIAGILNFDDSHVEYDEVMHDVHVARTGRYEIVSQPKTSTDKMGNMHVVVEVVDHGPEAGKPTRF